MDGDPSERFYIVSRPPNTPPQCVICGAGEHPVGFVVTQLDFEFYGSVYFCVSCARSMGRAAGCIEPEKFENMEDTISSLQIQLIYAQNELATFSELQDALDKIKQATTNLSATGAIDLSPSGEQGTEEPSNIEGPVYVPDVASDDEYSTTGIEF